MSFAMNECVDAALVCGRRTLRRPALASHATRSSPQRPPASFLTASFGGPSAIGDEVKPDCFRRPEGRRCSIADTRDGVSP